MFMQSGQIVNCARFVGQAKTTYHSKWRWQKLWRLAEPIHPGSLRRRALDLTSEAPRKQPHWDRLQSLSQQQWLA